MYWESVLVIIIIIVVKSAHAEITPYSQNISAKGQNNFGSQIFNSEIHEWNSEWIVLMYNFQICVSTCIRIFWSSYFTLGTAVAQWLRCCATNRKVAGSIPDGVIGIFHWHNPSHCTMTLGSTQPVTEMITRTISLPPPCAVVMKSGNLNFLEPSGPLQACNRTDYFTFSKTFFA